MALSDRLRAGETVFGCWVMLSGPAGAEMLATMGFDYMGIDCQHGLIGYEQLRDTMLALSGVETAPVVRVPLDDVGAIGKALDLGAEAIVVPMVNTPEHAERVASACRYPPKGERSFGLARGHQPLGRNPDDINRKVLCLPMIETIHGVDAAAGICSVDGVNGIYIGPSDLALSMGLDPMAEMPPEHEEAIQTVRAACVDAGIVPAIQVMNGEQAAQRRAQGFTMITVVADAAILALGALRELGAARA